MSCAPPPPPPGPMPMRGIPPPPPPGQGGIEALISDKRALAPEIEYVPPPPCEAVPDTLYAATFEAASPSALYNRLQLGVLLVIDLRSKEEFDKMHIRSAISLDWASLKDSHPDLMSLESALPPLFRRRRDFPVFLYDNDSTLTTPSSAVAAFMEALRQDRRCPLPIAVVQGGLAAILTSYPFLVKGHAKFIDIELPSEIVEGFLYLGNYATASNRAAIDALGITCIVNATDVCDMKFLDDPSISYLQCPLDDHQSANISQYFEPYLAFVRAAKNKGARVLVHCQQGMSRSASLVIFWLMVNSGMSLKQAFDYVRARRPFINPNAGFLFQLAKYELDHTGHQTIRFPEGHPLTMRCPYEWLGDDGVWRVRVMAESADDNGN